MPGASGTRQSHGLNIFSPSWTKMFQSIFPEGAEWQSESCRIRQVRLKLPRRIPKTMTDCHTPGVRSGRLDLPTDTGEVQKVQSHPMASEDSRHW